MRKITAVEFISLDGVAEAPEAWTPPYFNEELMEIAQAGMDSSDAMLLGRRTYQDFASYWPHQPREAPFVAWTNDSHKYVVSTTLTSLEYGPATLISKDVAAEVRNLKEQEGKGISLLGSPTLVRSLLPEGVHRRAHRIPLPDPCGQGQTSLRGANWGAGAPPDRLASAEDWGGGADVRPGRGVTNAGH
jgi:dihydrofolate reductase